MPQLDFTSLPVVTSPQSLHGFTQYTQQHVRLESMLKVHDTVVWHVDNEDPSQVGVIFCIEILRENISLFAKNEEVLQAAMQRVQLKTKDSTIPFVVFASVEPQFVPIVVKRLEELGLTPRKDSLEDPYQVLVLEHTDLLKLKSIGSAAAPLDPNDATDLNKIWEYGHNYKDPYAYILWNLTNNPTACLRDPKTNELLSYCFAHVDWNLGGLFTKDSERGKGYAKQVVAKCSLEMVLRGFTPYAYVSPSNNASLGVFRALGFTFLPLETIWIIAN